MATKGDARTDCKTASGRLKGDELMPVKVSLEREDLRAFDMYALQNTNGNRSKAFRQMLREFLSWKRATIESDTEANLGNS